VVAWDLHATGTPGDVSELKLSREFVCEKTAITARKGIFGHGMANAGGWELTALAMSLTERVTLPTAVPAGEIHPVLREKYGAMLAPAPRAIDDGVGVKMMLGIGGITACVLLRARRT
jgi:3-oxoacyl-(acyl-carrier-protein) synthase